MAKNLCALVYPVTVCVVIATTVGYNYRCTTYIVALVYPVSVCVAIA